MSRSRTMVPLLLLTILAAATLAVSPGCSRMRKAATRTRAASRESRQSAVFSSLDDLTADVKKTGGAAEILMAHLVVKGPKDDDLAAFNYAFCEDLVLRVTRLPEVRGQVPGWVVEKAMGQYRVASVNLSSQQAIKLARLAGRRHAMAGTIERQGGKIHAVIEVYDAKSARRVGEPIRLTGTPQEFLDREGVVAQQTAERIGVKPTPSDRAWLNRREFRDLADFNRIAHLLTHCEDDRAAKLAARRKQEPASLLVEREWLRSRSYKSAEESIAAAQASHKRFPEEPNFLSEIVERCFRLGDKTNAKQALDEYLGLHPGSWQGLNLRARYYYIMEDDEEGALKATETMAVLYPDCWLSWSRCSNAAMTLAQNARAGYYFSQMNAKQQAAFIRGMREGLAAAERARKLNDQDADLHIKLIHLYRENGMPQQAEASLKSAVALDPGRVDAYEALSWMYSKGYLNDKQRTIQIMRAALKAPAKTWPQIKIQAEIAFGLKENAKGVKLYQKALALAGDCYCPGLHMGYSYAVGEKFGRWEEAEKHARIAVGQYRNAETCLMLASALGRLKRYKEAMAAAQEAKRLEPNNAECDAVIAAIQYQTGEVSTALKSMAKASATEPREVQYLASMLDGHLKQGNYDKAWQVMRYVKHYPDWEKSGIELLDVADIHALKGQYKEAIKYYDMNLKKKPGHVKSLTRGALCYMMLGDFEHAAQRWRQVIRKQRDHAESHVGLAVCLSNIGQQEKAFGEARQAVTLNSDVGDPGWLKKNCYWPDRLGEAAAKLAAPARGR